MCKVEHAEKISRTLGEQSVKARRERDAETNTNTGFFCPLFLEHQLTLSVLVSNFPLGKPQLCVTITLSPTEFTSVSTSSKTLFGSDAQQP